MRKLLGLVFIPLFGVLCFFIAVGFMQPKIKVNYNGQAINFDGAVPFFYDDGQNSAIVVPSDIISTSMGATLTLNNDSKSITIKKSADTLIFYEDKNIAVVNGRDKKMPVKTVYKDNRLYIPIRILAENLGKSVFWDSGTASINIFDTLQNSFNLDNNSYKYASTDNFSIKDGKILFKSAPGEQVQYSDYTLEQKLNTNINNHIYGMAKALLDKSYYTGIKYNTKSEDLTINPVPNVTLSLAKSQADYNEKNTLFTFTFYEKKPLNVKRIWRQKEFSQSAAIMFELDKLFEGEKPQDGWVDPFYESRLKLAFLSLFGESVGLNISEYIVEEYNNIRNDTDGEYNSYKKSKRIEYVKVDIAHVIYPDSKDTIYVYLSF